MGIVNPTDFNKKYKVVIDDGTGELSVRPKHGIRGREMTTTTVHKPAGTPPPEDAVPALGGSGSGVRPRGRRGSGDASGRAQDDLMRMFLGLNDAGARGALEDALADNELSSQERADLREDHGFSAEFLRAFDDGKLTEKEAKRLGFKDKFFHLVDGNMDAENNTGDSFLTLDELNFATDTIQKYAKELGYGADDKGFGFKKAVRAYKNADSYRNVDTEELSKANTTLLGYMDSIGDGPWTDSGIAADQVVAALQDHVHHSLVQLVKEKIESGELKSKDDVAHFLLCCAMASMTRMYDTFGVRRRDLKDMTRYAPTETTDTNLTAWLKAGEVDRAARTPDTDPVEEYEGEYSDIAAWFDGKSAEQVLIKRQEMQQRRTELETQLEEILPRLKRYAETEGSGEDERIKVEDGEVVLKSGSKDDLDAKALAEEYIELAQEYQHVVEAQQILQAKMLISDDPIILNEARLAEGDYTAIINDDDAPDYYKAQAYYYSAIDMAASRSGGTIVYNNPDYLRKSLQLIKTAYADGTYAGVINQQQKDALLNLYSTVVMALVENGETDIAIAKENLDALATALETRIASLEGEATLSKEDLQLLLSLKQSIIRIQLLRHDYVSLREQTIALITRCQEDTSIPTSQKDSIMNFAKGIIQESLRQATFGNLERIEASQAMLIAYEKAGGDWQAHEIPYGKNPITIRNSEDIQTELIDEHDDQWIQMGAVEAFEAMYDGETIRTIEFILPLAYMYKNMTPQQRSDFITGRTGIRGGYEVEDTDPPIVREVMGKGNDIPTPEQFDQFLEKWVTFVATLPEPEDD